MSPCDDCPFEQKLLLCCSLYPPTGDQKLLLIEGKSHAACIYLNEKAQCEIYSHRPKGCREFFCERYLLEEKMHFYWNS